MFETVHGLYTFSGRLLFRSVLGFVFFLGGGDSFFIFFAFVHALLLAFSFIRFVFMDIDLS